MYNLNYKKLLKLVDQVSTASNVPLKKVTSEQGINFAKPDGSLLSEQWFHTASPFKDGFSVVSFNDKNGDLCQNMIDEKGNFLLKQNVDQVAPFFDGIATVHDADHGYNFVDRQGNLLSDIWFEGIGRFHEGFAKVSIGGKGYNFMDKSGNLISNKWFDDARDFRNGFAVVEVNDGRDYGYNYLKSDGTMLSDQMFEEASDFKNGSAKVKLMNGKVKRITADGELVDYRKSNLNCKESLKLSDSQETASIKKAVERLASGEDPHNIFNYVYAFNEGFSCVQLRNKYNFIDKEGNFLSDQWFDDAGDFYEGFARVMLNDKWNFIDTNGNFLSDQWFDVAYSFHDGFACVWLKDKINFIDTEGDFLSDRWFDDTIDFRDGAVRVKLDGRWHHIDKHGTILDSKRTYNLNCKKLLKHIK